MGKKEMIQRAREAGVKLIRLLYCGNDGVIRGKATHIDYFERVANTGMGLTVAMQSFTSLDKIAEDGGFGPVGEIRLLPDPETFSILPYSPKNAMVLCDMVRLDRKIWEACPRYFLRRMVSRCAEKGLLVRAALENEFYLAVRDADGNFAPMDNSPCFSSIGMDFADEVVHDIIDCLNAQGVKVERYYPELGPAQQEIPIGYEGALKAADNQLVFRETVRGVARKHNLYAVLAPKPFPGEAGNGCHIHFSLWDTKGEANAFYDPRDKLKISPLAYHFIGGILKHVPALLVLTAPSYNSFRRLQPHFWSSAFACYGPDNREAAVRIASGFWDDEMGSTNLEYKPADPSCNPYIALGGLIAAGLDGVEKEIHPGEAVLQDPANYTPEERQKLGIKRFPQDLGSALLELQKDNVLQQAMGSVLFREYLAVKNSEWLSFKEKDIKFEIDSHIYKY